MYILFIGVGDIQRSTREEILGLKSGATLTSQSQVCTGWCPRWSPLDLKSTTYFSTRNQSFNIGCSRCALQLERQHQTSISFSGRQKWPRHIYCSDTGDRKPAEGHVSSLSERQSVCPLCPQHLVVCEAGKLLWGCKRGDSPHVGFLSECRAGCLVPPQAASSRQNAWYAEVWWIRKPSPGQTTKPWSKCLLHEGPTDHRGSAGNHPLHWRVSCKPCCLKRSVHMRENTTTVGVSLWHYSFWSAGNPMPPQTFPSIHPCHPASCHTAFGFHFSMATATMGRPWAFMTNLNITSWIRLSLIYPWLAFPYFILFWNIVFSNEGNIIIAPTPLYFPLSPSFSVALFFDFTFSLKPFAPAHLLSTFLSYSLNKRENGLHFAKLGFFPSF